jgi:hypothetical protein
MFPDIQKDSRIDGIGSEKQETGHLEVCMNRSLERWTDFLFIVASREGRNNLMHCYRKVEKRRSSERYESFDRNVGRWVM